MANNFVVDRGIPFPPSPNGKRARTIPTCVYPWEKMEVGDSFFVPCNQRLRPSKQSGLYNAGRCWGELRDRVFATRTVTGGVRVWRLS